MSKNKNINLRFRNKIFNALKMLAKCLLWFDIQQDKSLLYMDHLTVQKRLSKYKEKWLKNTSNSTIRNLND